MIFIWKNANCCSVNVLLNIIYILHEYMLCTITMVSNQNSVFDFQWSFIGLYVWPTIYCTTLTLSPFTPRIETYLRILFRGRGLTRSIVLVRKIHSDQKIISDLTAIETLYSGILISTVTKPRDMLLTETCSIVCKMSTTISN